MSEIAVLGCGPAGLLVAHAVRLSGHTPVVFSVKQKSRIGGAQYLHSSIAGLTNVDADGKVEFIKVGDRDGYAEKVYGDVEAPTSWEEFEEGTHSIWNMQQAYSDLWVMYNTGILDMALDQEVLVGILTGYPLTLSTIPPKAYCYNPEHSFLKQSVWITEERRCDPMQILYNGMGEISWYRSCNLWGHTFTEYAEIPSHLSVKINKPLKTDCDCYPGIVRLGRYGRWEKKQLIHDAYFGALAVLNAL